jgi:hypothetical protein
MIVTDVQNEHKVLMLGIEKIIYLKKRPSKYPIQLIGDYFSKFLNEQSIVVEELDKNRFSVSFLEVDALKELTDKMNHWAIADLVIELIGKMWGRDCP